MAEEASTLDSSVVGPVSGPVPLTPIQHWFFAQELPSPHHFNQAVLLEAGGPGERVDAGRLAHVIERLLEHHDALRIWFEPSAGESPLWRQVNRAAAGGAPCGEIDLSALPEERQRPALDAAAAQLQASLDLSAGPLLRAALFRPASAPDRLLLIVHHLVVDGVSWRILLEDLETTYRQLAGGEAVALPPKTTSFQRWAEHLAARAAAPAVEQQRAYWLGVLQRGGPRLPLDRELGANDVASARYVAAGLDAEQTRALLQEVPRAYRTQINDVLLAALAEALAPWTGSRRLLLDLEGHGRELTAEELDLSRTVGWFTAIFPVALDLQAAVDPADALKQSKEQLRAVPEHGAGFGLLRYLHSAAAEELRALPQPEILFNYLGQLDQAMGGSFLRPARESAGPGRDPRQPRQYLLEISGSVAGGRLSLVWTYSENRHHRATIAALAERFVAALGLLIAHGLSPEAGGYTPRASRPRAKAP